MRIDKMQEKPPKQQITNNPENARDREKFLYPIIGAMTGLVLSISFAQTETSDRLAVSTQDIIDEAVASRPVNADLFEEMTIVRIDNPDDTYEAGLLANEETKKQFVNGIAELSRASAGRLTIPEDQDVRVVEIDLTPDAEAIRQNDKGVDVPYNCYSNDALEEVKRIAFAEHGIPRTSLTAISLESNGGAVCGMAHAGAYVTLGSYAEAGIYQHNSLRRDVSGHIVREGVSPRLSIIPHELGHTARIQHSSITQYDYETYNIEDRDSIETTIRKGLHLAVKRNEDHEVIHDVNGQTEVAEYENADSVMGSLDFWGTDGMGFNFIEQNKLNPEAAQIIEIDGTEEIDIPISVDGSIRGVVLDLPENHPLHNIERGKPLDKVYVGIEYRNGSADDPQVRPYLEEAYRGATYQLYHERYSPGFQHDVITETDRELYRDETIGVAITVDSEVGDFRNATLHVQPLE